MNQKLRGSVLKILKKACAFDHVEIMLRDLFGNHPVYENTTLLLGYNVFTIAEFNDTLATEKAAGNKVIAYQLEQLYDKSPWLLPHCIEFLRQCDEVWDYDLNNIQYLWGVFGIKSKLRPMLYSNALKTIVPTPYEKCDIDFLFYGSMNKARSDMLNYIQRYVGKNRVTYLDNAWGVELDEAISRSKVILNLHYYPVGRQEQVRMFYPVINGKCVLSEQSERNYLGKSILDVRAEDVPQVCDELVGSGAWRQMAESAPKTYTKLSSEYISRFQ